MKKEEFKDHRRSGMNNVSIQDALVAAAKGSLFIAANGKKLLQSVLAAAFVLFFAAVLVGRPSPAFAGDPAPGDMPKPEKITDCVMSRLQERLGLSAEQAAKARPVIEAGIQKRMELFKQMEELRKSTDEKLASILDDKQMKKFHRLQRKWRRRMGERFSSCGCRHRHHHCSGEDREDED
jgi:hypothetical protein